MNSVNQLLALLPEGGWQRLMCDALWQSALIAALGCLVARFLVRHAAPRAWVLLLTATACIIVPLASAASRDAGWTVLARVETTASNEEGEKGSRGAGEMMIEERPMESPSALAVSPAEPQLLLPAPPAAEPDETEDQAASALHTPATLTAPVLPFSPSPILAPSAAPAPKLNRMHALGLAWLTASALLALRLAFSALAVRKILRHAKPCDEARLLAAAAEAASRVGLHEAPPVFVSDRIESPMVLALGRPQLLVPQCTPHAPREDEAEQTIPARQMSATSDAPNRSEIDAAPTASSRRSVKSTLADVNWTAAFTHELAHVARRDGWWRLWIELVAIALPLQPLVWLVRRNFHLACEEACDDCSVAAGSDPVDLAETLTAWLGRRTPKPATAIGMSSTKARVLRLLAMRETPPAKVPQIWRWLSVPALLLIIAGLAVAQVSNEPNRELATPEPPAQSQPSPTAGPTPTATKEAPPKLAERALYEVPEHIVAGAIARDPEIARLSETIEALQQAIKRQEAAVKFPEQDPTIRILKAELEKARKEFASREEKIWPSIIQYLKQELDSRNSPHRSMPPYIIEPPDIVLIDAVRIVPKAPAKIQPLDVLEVEVSGTGFTSAIRGLYLVESSGKMNFGPFLGKVKTADLTIDEANAAITKHFKQTFTDPKVSLRLNESGGQQQIAGEHLVAPDGTINLGNYGQVYVTGLSVPQAKAAIERHLSKYFDDPIVAVDVFAYNSKVYYVIVESKKLGTSIQRFPITGNETVLDAISNIGGLSRISSKNIWISRPSPTGDQILPVKWDEIVTGGKNVTNYQVLPGDRVFIAAAANEAELVGETKKIRAELLDSDDPNTWRWKLFIPKGNRYAWKIAYDDIPKQTPPPEGTSHISAGYSNEPYYETDNEVLVTAKLLKLENGNWRMSVSSRINSESGEPTWQMSGISAEIPAGSLKWRGTIGTDGQTLGDHGNVLVDASDQIILLQSRPLQRQPDRTHLPAEGTAPGFMIWMEKWGEKLSPDSAPQTTPPATPTIPPQGSAPTPPETAPIDRSVPDALWPRPSMPNALDSNSPYRRSQSALKDTTKPAPPDGNTIPPIPANAPTPPNFRNIGKLRQLSYSVIVKNVPGRKDSVERFQYKGDETVVDAISQIQDLTKMNGVFIWILRPAEDPSKGDVTIDVDWKTDHKAPPKLLAGDRVFITGGRAAVREPAPADAKQKADGDPKQSPPASQFPTY